MSRHATALFLALFLLALIPDVAHACPVCFDPREENRMAFLATTAFLSLLPLGMVAGAGFWLRRRLRRLEATALADEPSDEPAQRPGE